MMKKIRIPLLLSLMAGAVLIATGVACSSESTSTPATETPAGSSDLDKIKLPAGFKIEVYADKVKGARSMVLGDKGTLFVGTRGRDEVYALIDKNGDFKVDEVKIIADDLYSPNGVAFRDGNLYIAEINKVLRLDDIENHLDNPPTPVVVTDDLPNERHHGWKYINFGPDGKLYVPVGAPCNVCERTDDPRFASIMRMEPDGSSPEIIAKGVRNSVGFDWHPGTGELWFTDNGRDWLGDDQPNDELNRLPAAGTHFGFPFCHQGDILDPEYGIDKDCKDYFPPAQKLGPHVAALGMKFYTGDMFPESYKNRIFIALHGSWNRKEKIGYSVMTVTLDGNKVVDYQPFAEGFLQGSTPFSRPVDLLQMPDGSMLLSDDHGDKIYRITYQK